MRIEENFLRKEPCFMAPREHVLGLSEMRVKTLLRPSFSSGSSIKLTILHCSCHILLRFYLLRFYLSK